MSALYIPIPRSSTRDKLGLSLAGGGFRASLFHLGVLHRMAELDLLRYVEVLSTVSGGSIVGALYVLMLQERLKAKAPLDRKDYEELVEELERVFQRGVQKDLRTRLLMNPLGVLGVLLSHDSLGRRMGRIYARYLYKDAVEALRKQTPELSKGGRLATRLWPLTRWLWPGWISLRSLRFTPGGAEVEGGLEGYNAKVVSAVPPGSAIPNFILNSTALNSGAPFRFSSVEIGDPRLGYFRYDEIKCLKARKTLLDYGPTTLSAILGGKMAAPRVEGAPLDLSVVELARAWMTRDTDATASILKPSARWANLFGNQDAVKVSDSMCKTNFGRLRQLKLPAWYVRKGPEKRVTGGLDREGYLARFNQVLREVEPTVSGQIRDSITEQDALGQELLDFAIELYYLRSAEAMSWRLCKDFDSLSLATAVAASANFPPVFPPLVLLGIYDDLHVSRLGLSDGGVYDNLGLTPLLEEGCSHIIVSDTGAPFEVQQRASSGYVGMIARLPDVLTEDIADQQRTQLRERRRVSDALSGYPGGNKKIDDIKAEYGLDGLAFFSIDSVDPPGGYGVDLGAVKPAAVASLRTDLDSFGDLEIAALINTGYDRADRFIREYFKDSSYSKKSASVWNSQARPPRSIDGKYAEAIPKVLRVGQSRLFRSLRLLSVWSWLFTGVVAAAAFYWLVQSCLSTEGLIDRISPWIVYRLTHPFPSFLDTPVNRWMQLLVEGPIWIILIALILLLVVVFKLWPSIVKRSPRKVATVFKWIRAFAPVLFLLVSLAPVWIAVAACIIALVSYFAYNKPFLWKTRMP